MPRKKKPVVSTDDPELRKVLDDFGVIPASELPEDVEKIMREVGEDVTKVLLYRRLKGEKQSYVATLDADEFAMDEIARRWGGGRYLARLVGPEGILKGVTFYIDESLKPQSKDSLPGSNPFQDKLLERLLDRSLQPQASVDPAAIAAAIATAASSQLAAMMGAMAPLLGKITELASGGGKAGSPTSDLFEAINLGLSLGGKDDGIMGAVERVGVPLVKIAGDALALQSAKRGTLRRPLINPPAGKPSETEAASVTANLQPGVPAWVQLVRGFVPTIVEFAARNEDPEILAIGLEQQQPRVADWLDKKVTEPDFEPTLLGAFPALEVHREWVHRFLAEFGPDEPEAEVEDEGSPAA